MQILLPVTVSPRPLAPCPLLGPPDAATSTTLRAMPRVKWAPPTSLVPPSLSLPPPPLPPPLPPRGIKFPGRTVGKREGCRRTMSVAGLPRKLLYIEQ